jgi:hypothetical protein
MKELAIDARLLWFFLSQQLGWSEFKPILWRILHSWVKARYCNAIETLVCISRVVPFIFNQTLGNRHSSRPAALLGSVGKREAGSI